jgi:hypothetical protein
MSIFERITSTGTSVLLKMMTPSWFMVWWTWTIIWVGAGFGVRFETDLATDVTFGGSGG